MTLCIFPRMIMLASGNTAGLRKRLLSATLIPDSPSCNETGINESVDSGNLNTVLIGAELAAFLRAVNQTLTEGISPAPHSGTFRSLGLK